VRPSSIGVIGLGAIGGSIAWQARLAGVARVIGYSPRSSETVQALKASAITEAADSAASLAGQAELVVLATPPTPTLQLIESLATALPPESLVTDVCSVKAPIVKQALASGLGDRFAGGHPLAGTHETGFPAARPDRFQGCVVYICETGTSRGHLAAAAVAGFWEEVLGASPVMIEAEAHDRQLAWTSHLPQAVAYALAHALSDQGLGSVSFGSGAKDTMRLAGSSPELWIDVLRHNAAALSGAMQRTEEALAELRRLLATDDADELRRFLETALTFRQGMGS
jgi:prephenate dehydrogenase